MALLWQNEKKLSGRFSAGKGGSKAQRVEVETPVSARWGVFIFSESVFLGLLFKMVWSRQDKRGSLYCHHSMLPLLSGLVCIAKPESERLVFKGWGKPSLLSLSCLYTIFVEICSRCNVNTSKALMKFNRRLQEFPVASFLFGALLVVGSKKYDTDYYIFGKSRLLRRITITVISGL